MPRFVSFVHLEEQKKNYKGFGNSSRLRAGETYFQILVTIGKSAVCTRLRIVCTSKNCGIFQSRAKSLVKLFVVYFFPSRPKLVSQLTSARSANFAGRARRAVHYTPPPLHVQSRCAFPRATQICHFNPIQPVRSGSAAVTALPAAVCVDPRYAPRPRTRSSGVQTQQPAKKIRKLVLRERRRWLRG